MNKPDIDAATATATTETLARWLAQGWDAVAGDVRGWRGPDWQAAVWAAYWQGGIPALAARLRENDRAQAEGLGRYFDLAALLEVSAFSHARTERLLALVHEMIEGLRPLGIEIAPLKGARLAPYYYQPAALRPMGDVDVLLRPADVRRAGEWAAANGFTFYSRSEEDVVYLRGGRMTEVWHPDNVHPVELHFRLREEFGGAGLTWDFSDDAWQGAVRQPYLGTETSLVSPIFLLRHLCAHTTSDIFIRRGKLQQMEDIARVARTFTAEDWGEFVMGTPSSRARFVVPALALTARYYLEAIPATVLGALGDMLKPRLRAWVAGLSLAAVSESNFDSRSGLGISLSRLIAVTPAETSRALVTSFLPPRWNLMKRYPRLAASPLYPLCYVLLNADRAWQMASSRRQVAGGK